MNTMRTFKRSIAGAATAAAFFAFAACGADAPAQDIPTGEKSSEKSDFTPKYGEHSDKFRNKGPSTVDNKAPEDFKP